jgi:hypothetical protein
MIIKSESEAYIMPKNSKSDKEPTTEEYFNELEEDDENSEKYDELQDIEEIEDISNLEPLKKLTEDIKVASQNMSTREARYIVDMYYIMQKDRNRFGNQINMMTKSNEPHTIIDYFFTNFKINEVLLKKALDIYTDHHPIGRWVKSICGVGPVIAAGIIAHIDIHKAPTAGHLWSYAGLVPSRRWIGNDEAKQILTEVIGKNKDIKAEHIELLRIKTGWSVDYLIKFGTDEKSGIITKTKLQKAIVVRPFNAGLKRLCWIFADSIIKRQNNKADFYGKRVYAWKKAFYIDKNNNFGFRDTALAKAKTVGTSTVAFKSYSIGKLPDGHIDAMARRYVAKIFLSHLQQVWYEHEFKTPAPKPFVQVHLGHTDIIQPPNLEIIFPEKFGK